MTTLRRQVAEEIAQAIEDAGDKRSKHRHHERPTVSRLGSVRHASYLAAARIAREIGSQPAPDASEPRTDPGMDSDLPLEPQAARSPQEDA